MRNPDYRRDEPMPNGGTTHVTNNYGSGKSGIGGTALGTILGAGVLGAALLTSGHYGFQEIDRRTQNQVASNAQSITQLDERVSGNTYAINDNSQRIGRLEKDHVTNNQDRTCNPGIQRNTLDTIILEGNGIRPIVTQRHEIDMSDSYSLGEFARNFTLGQLEARANTVEVMTSDGGRYILSSNRGLGDQQFIDHINETYRNCTPEEIIIDAQTVTNESAAAQPTRATPRTPATTVSYTPAPQTARIAQVHRASVNQPAATRDTIEFRGRNYRVNDTLPRSDYTTHTLQAMKENGGCGFNYDHVRVQGDMFGRNTHRLGSLEEAVQLIASSQIPGRFETATIRCIPPSQIGGSKGGINDIGETLSPDPSPGPSRGGAGRRDPGRGVSPDGRH